MLLLALCRPCEGVCRAQDGVHCRECSEEGDTSACELFLTGPAAKSSVHGLATLCVSAELAESMVSIYAASLSGKGACCCACISRLVSVGVTSPPCHEGGSSPCP